ncbi:hypothetical protein V1525DRAFT_429263 [Lipomyces kononenkoae]|uniref:Uncharacterized protein n=1 Tax=Lipomyces kononenkoae TaxID=34357 RepID=A0ACC3TAR0_LIPKO
MPELSAKDLFEKDLSLRSPFPRGSNVAPSTTPVRPTQIGPPVFAPPKPGSGFKPPTSATKLVAPSARRPGLGDANNKLQRLFYQSPMPRISNPALARYNPMVSSSGIGAVYPSYSSVTTTPLHSNPRKSTTSAAPKDNVRYSPVPAQIQPVAPPPQTPARSSPPRNDRTPAPLPVPPTSAAKQNNLSSAATEATPKSRSLGYRIGDLLGLVSGVRHAAEPEKSLSKDVSPVQQATTVTETLYAEKEPSADIPIENAPSDSQSLSSNSSISSNIAPSSASSTTNANAAGGLLPSASVTKRIQKSRVISIPEPLPQLGMYESRASSASPIVTSRRKLKKRSMSPAANHPQSAVAKVSRGKGIHGGRRGRSSLTRQQTAQNMSNLAMKAARRSITEQHVSPSIESESDAEQRVGQYESRGVEKTLVSGSAVQEVPDSEPESASPENMPGTQPNLVVGMDLNQEKRQIYASADSSVMTQPLTAVKHGRRQSRSLPDEQPSRRSGRTRVKPLEYWRNERIVYCLVHDEEQGEVVPSIRRIVRAERDGVDHSDTGKKRRRGETT